MTHSFRSMSEKIRGTPFDEIPLRYQGYQFTVDDIDATGIVTIFLNEADGSPDAQELGLPMDLNGDGAASTPDVSSSYLLLPIKIEISWTGRRDPQTRKHYFFLSLEE